MRFFSRTSLRDVRHGLDEVTALLTSSYAFVTIVLRFWDLMNPN